MTPYFIHNGIGSMEIVIRTHYLSMSFLYVFGFVCGVCLELAPYFIHYGVINVEFLISSSINSQQRPGNGLIEL